MAMGEDDAWIWWALVAGVLAMAALAVAIVAARRGAAASTRAAYGAAGMAVLFMLASLYRLLA